MLSRTSRWTKFTEKKRESIENLGLLVRSPGALLLCALCSMKEPLHIIYEQGGFEAIVVFAHEQDINAVRAMQEVCNEFVSSLLSDLLFSSYLLFSNYFSV